MAKKRKCRYTAEELAIHEEAVSLRKMTDRQLVDAVRREAPRAPQEPPKEKEPDDKGNLAKLLAELAEGRCKGIKSATAEKITAYAKERGLI